MKVRAEIDKDVVSTVEVVAEDIGMSRQELLGWIVSQQVRDIDGLIDELVDQRKQKLKEKTLKRTSESQKQEQTDSGNTQEDESDGAEPHPDTTIPSTSTSDTRESESEEDDAPVRDVKSSRPNRKYPDEGAYDDEVTTEDKSNMSMDELGTHMDEKMGLEEPSPIKDEEFEEWADDGMSEEDIDDL